MDRAHRPLQLIAPLLQAVLLEQGRQLAHLVRVVRLRLRLKVRVGVRVRVRVRVRVSVEG